MADMQQKAVTCLIKICYGPYGNILITIHLRNCKKKNKNKKIEINKMYNAWTHITFLIKGETPK